MNILLAIEGNINNIFLSSKLVAASLLKDRHRVFVVCNDESLCAEMELLGYEVFCITLKPKTFKENIKLLLHHSQILATTWSNGIQKVLDMYQFQMALLMSDGKTLYSATLLTMHKLVPITIFYFPHALFLPLIGDAIDRVTERLARQGENILFNATYIAFDSMATLHCIDDYYSILRNKMLYLPIPYLVAIASQEHENRETHNTQFVLRLYGNLIHNHNVHRFIAAFSLFIRSLSVQEREQVTLEINGSITHNLIDSTLHPYIKAMPIEGKREASVAICIDSDYYITEGIPPHFAAAFASNLPLLSITSPHGELSFLLGDDYPFLCKGDDIEEIFLMIWYLWEEWKSGRLAYFLYSYTYSLMSSNNFNAVITMAMEASNKTNRANDIR